MKKILFVYDNWLGDINGRRRVTLNLINNLTDYDIHLLTLETKVLPPKVKSQFIISQEKGIKKYHYFIKKNFIFLFKLFFKFGIVLKRIKPDLIICVGGGPHSNAFFILISKLFLRAKPTIVIIHGDPKPFLNKQNFIIRFFTKLFFKMVDKVISVSRELNQAMKKIFNLKDSQCTFIYNGFDLKEILKEAQEKVTHPWFEENIPIILTAGRLESYSKDFLTLIEAFSKVRKNIKSRLIILGEGPQKEELKKIVRDLKIEKDVDFLGFQKNPYKFMRESSIFILSSKFEALPSVLVEALICGLPVISTDCDFGPREILENGKCGILVPVGNTKKMAEAILELLENKTLREQFINNGKNRVSEFSIENSISKYRKIFSEILI